MGVGAVALRDIRPDGRLRRCSHSGNFWGEMNANSKIRRSISHGRFCRNIFWLSFGLSGAVQNTHLSDVRFSLRRRLEEVLRIRLPPSLNDGVGSVPVEETGYDKGGDRKLVL